MPDTERYLDRITAQHRTKPRFMAWLSANLDVVDAVCEAAGTVGGAFLLEGAQGPQLDVLGELVGMSRVLPGDLENANMGRMEDETYRKMLCAKIVKNQWDGQQENITGIWRNTFGDKSTIQYHDNQDMSIDVRLDGRFTPLETELILRGHIIPKPSGVRINLDLAETVEADAQAAFRTSVGSSFPHNNARIGIESSFGQNPAQAYASIVSGACALASYARITVQAI